MAVQTFCVLSASFGTMEDSKGKSMDYASLIVTNGKLSRIQRDDRTGVDASKMRCDITLARRLVKDNALPCIGDVDFELDGPKGNPMAFDVIYHKGSKEVVLKTLADLFSKKFDITELPSNVSSNAIPSGITSIPSGITPLTRDELIKQSSTPLKP